MVRAEKAVLKKQGFTDMHYISQGKDMLKVEYPNGLLLNVRSCGKEAGFVIYIIRDRDWDHPVAKRVVKSQKKLGEEIEAAFSMISRQCMA